MRAAAGGPFSLRSGSQLGNDNDMSELDFGSGEAAIPLPERMRPKRLEDVVGQDALIGPQGRLRRMLESGNLSSIILWGPPGSGKTTIARVLADAAPMDFEPVAAVCDGVAEVR